MLYVLSLLVISCTTPIQNETLLTTQTAPEVKDNLGGSTQGFLEYRGGLLDGGGFGNNPRNGLGKVWRRNQECADAQVVEGCLWIPDYSDLRISNLTLFEDTTPVEYADTTIYVEDASNIGLFDFLEVQMLETSAVRMSIIQTYYGEIENDNCPNFDNECPSLEEWCLNCELATFVEGYGDSDKEQAYIKQLEMYEITLVEYYFQSLEEPSDWGKNPNLYYFGDGYYVDSGLFNKRIVAVVTLQPIQTE